MKLTRKQKLVRTLGFFLDFSSAHFDHCKLRYAACAPGDHWTCGTSVDHGDHGSSVSDEIDQKTKIGQNTW